MSESDFPERFTNGNGHLELTDEVTDAITVTEDQHAGNTTTHEPTGISESYSVAPFARDMNPNALRDTARRQLVRDHPEILDHHLETDGSPEPVTDGGRDAFHDVCDECGRHIAVAGHAPDCPNRSDPDVETDGGREPSAFSYTLTDEDPDTDALTAEYVKRFAELNPELRLESATFRVMTTEDGGGDGIPAPEFPEDPENWTEDAEDATEMNDEQAINELGGGASHDIQPDGGEPIPEELETERFRGAVYPSPGAWELNTAEMDGVTWDLNPATDSEGYQTADARAFLANEFPDTPGEDPTHTLSVDGEDVLTFTGNGNWTEGGLWRQVHDALADADPDHTHTAPEDPDSGEGTDTNPPDSTLDDYATDGGLNLPDDIPAWERKAHENVQKWGQQDLDALTLAMGEEMGEFAGSVLAAHEPGDSDLKSEHGRDLLRRMKALGEQIQDYLETVTEDSDGVPVPTEDRPNYLTRGDERPHHRLFQRHAREELDDLMALGYQTLWAMEAPPEGSTDE